MILSDNVVSVMESDCCHCLKWLSNHEFFFFFNNCFLCIVPYFLGLSPIIPSLYIINLLVGKYILILITISFETILN